jgi:hypothetical protein
MARFVRRYLRTVTIVALISAVLINSRLRQGLVTLLNGAVRVIRGTIGLGRV